MSTTARDIYHTIRRARGIYITPGNSRTSYVGRGIFGSVTQMRKVPVPRGCGSLRDLIAERISKSMSLTGDTLPLRLRLNAHYVRIYSEVIEDRGGETSIEEKDRTIGLSVIERRDGLVLLGCDGWRHYSARFGARKASLRYLCGTDDNGRWAVRVPGTVQCVMDALDFVEPAEVKAARSAGRRVLRQGDVYLVEQSRDSLDALAGTRHRWDAATRTLHHDASDAPHTSLHVPYKAKAVVQSVLRMGRTTGRRRGD